MKRLINSREMKLTSILIAVMLAFPLTGLAKVDAGAKKKSVDRPEAQRGATSNKLLAWVEHARKGGKPEDFAGALATNLGYAPGEAQWFVVKNEDVKDGARHYFAYISSPGKAPQKSRAMLVSRFARENLGGEESIDGLNCLLGMDGALIAAVDGRGKRGNVVQRRLDIKDVEVRTRCEKETKLFIEQEPASK